MRSYVYLWLCPLVNIDNALGKELSHIPASPIPKFSHGNAFLKALTLLAKASTPFSSFG